MSLVVVTVTVPAFWPVPPLPPVAPAAPTETTDAGLPVEIAAESAAPPLPPDPPIDWATMPGDASILVLIVPLAVTTTLLPILPLPPKPPIAVEGAATVEPAALALKPPAPPSPPIDCARMAGDKSDSLQIVGR